MFGGETMGKTAVRLAVYNLLRYGGGWGKRPFSSLSFTLPPPLQSSMDVAQWKTSIVDSGEAVGNV